MKMSSPTFVLLICISLFQMNLAAFEPSVVKLLGKNGAASAGNRFGSCVAMNERWIVVGEPNNSEGAMNAGAVHVYEAATGKHRIRLQGDMDSGAYFGDAVALDGDHLVVGAPFEDTSLAMNSGACYVIHLPSGKRVRKIVPAGTQAGDRVGCSVGMHGNLVVFGAYLADAPGADSGAVYVFDVTTGVQLWKLTGDNTAASDWFGRELSADGGLVLVSSRNTTLSSACYLFDLRTGVQLHRMGIVPYQLVSSLALSGRRALLGYSNSNDGAASGGAASLFDCDTGLLVKHFWPSDVQMDDGFGGSVALHGKLAFIGAQGRDGQAPDSGAAFLFDMSTMAQLAELHPSDGQTGNLLGNSVAMWGNRMLAGAYYDNDLGNQSGSVYLVGPVSGSSPFRRIAAIKDSAPGIPEATYSSLFAPAINPDSEVIFHGRLAGSGAAAGKSRGVWSTLAANQILRKLAQSGLDLGNPMPGLKMVAVTGVLANQSNHAYFHSTFSGAGVSSTNNQAILRDDGGTFLDLMMRTGDAVAETGGTLLGFRQILQSSDTSESLAVVYRLRQGISGITAASDSGILRRNLPGGMYSQAREGMNVGVPTLGEITRAAFFDKYITFAAALRGKPTSENHALFKYPAGMSGIPTYKLIKGNTATGAGSAKYAAFLGETLSPVEEITAKVTLSGLGVTAKNRLCLTSERFGTFDVVVRADSLVGAEAPGLRYGSISKFWALAVDRVLFLATLRGPGVTSSNDQILAVADEGGGVQILMREGQVAQGCSHSRIGVIQDVVAEPLNNRYAVLVSLVGASSATNQALYVGRIQLLLSKRALWRPVLAVRKGALFQSQGGSAAVLRSLSWFRNPNDATGAGAKGLGTPINSSGALSLLVTMANGNVQAAVFQP